MPNIFAPKVKNRNEGRRHECVVFHLKALVMWRFWNIPYFERRINRLFVYPNNCHGFLSKMNQRSNCDDPYSLILFGATATVCLPVWTTKTSWTRILLLLQSDSDSSHFFVQCYLLNTLPLTRCLLAVFCRAVSEARLRQQLQLLEYESCFFLPPHNILELSWKTRAKARPLGRASAFSACVSS